jgi:TetR/AcrR family transcriptional regulator, cholesterol catabolism regulator
MRKVRTYSTDKKLVNERRSQIVKVATELIIKKGYNNINTRELASALGMSTGGLYHYIGSKEDILYLIINFTAELTSQTIDSFAKLPGTLEPSQRIKESLRIYLSTANNYRDFINFVNHIMLSLTVNDRKIVYAAEGRLVDYFENVLKNGVQEGKFKDHDTRLLAHNIVILVNAWANRGWYLKKHYSIDKYIEEQTAAILSQVEVPSVSSQNNRSKITVSRV